MLSLIVASFVAVATRAALLCYLDATAIPSLTSVYASSASPFLIIAAGLSTLGGVAKLAAKRVGAGSR